MSIQADLLYNPYLKEATLTVEGKPVVLDCFGDNKTNELSEWISDFFEDLDDLFAQKEMHLTFTGIERDLDFLIDAANFMNKNAGYHVTVEPRKIIKPNAKLDRLKEMFEKLQRESPFEELKTENIRRNFEKAVSDEFEMAVVATMSSGKSTLINAMLGREIPPARNESTTATIARIHNIDGAPHFRATAYDSAGEEIASHDPVSLENMNELNNNGAVSSIEIEGDIKGINNSDKMKLVLIDTPGPNNSRDMSHKNITYDLLKQEYKPMILYILNATQLEVNDDHYLLEHVSQEIQKSGRQSRDRFLFVLNKADVLDPEKGESVAKKIEDVRAYLDSFGIRDPRIFPCASQMAKIIRQMQTDENAITARERRTLMNDADFFIETEACHFSDFALKGNGLLGKEAREKLQAMLTDAKKHGDRYGEALIYAGIPSVELAISEYLSKYALPAKITKGLDSFIQVISNTSAEATAIQEIAGSEKKIEEAKKALETVEAALKDGDKARDLRLRIEVMSSQEAIKNEWSKVVEDFVIEYGQKKKKMDVARLARAEARRSFNELKNFLEDRTSWFQALSKNILQENVVKQGEEYIKEYRLYLESLVGDLGGLSGLRDPASVFGSLASLSLDDVLVDYTSTRQVKVGEHEELVGTRKVKNPERKGFLGFFKFWKPSEIDENVYKTVIDYEAREEVDFQAYIRDNVTPLVEKFLETNEKDLMEAVDDYEKSLKAAFLAKFDQLETKIQEKVGEKRDYLDKLERGKADLADNQKKLDWYKKYMAELKNLLVDVED